MFGYPRYLSYIYNVNKKNNKGYENRINKMVDRAGKAR